MVYEVELVEVVKEVPRYVLRSDFDKFIKKIGDNDPGISGIKLQEVSSEGLVLLFQALKKNKHVKKIDFSDREFDSGKINFIAKHLKESRVICEVNFSNSNLNDEWANVLIDALDNHCSITSIIVDGCKYISREFVEIKTTKEQLEKLKDRYLKLTTTDSSRPIYLEYGELLEKSLSDIAKLEVMLARAEFSIFLAARPRYHANQRLALLLHARTDYAVVENFSPGNKRASDGLTTVEHQLKKVNVSNAHLMKRSAFQ